MNGPDEDYLEWGRHQSGASYFTSDELCFRWRCTRAAVSSRMQRSPDVRRIKHPTDQRVALYMADDIRALERELGLSVRVVYNEQNPGGKT